eukprot:1623535-Amphidinium_carterae.1
MAECSQLCQVTACAVRQWCSFTPAQRAVYTTGAYQGFQMSPPLGIIEAHVKSELLTTKIPPEEFITYLVGAKRGSNLAEILELLFQRYLPSERAARVDALSLLEVPLKVAKSFVEGLRLLGVEGAVGDDRSVTSWSP